jgi:hypothetical protein
MIKTLTRIAVFALVLGALPLAAQTYDWSYAGSTGSVDPTGLFKITYSGSVLKFNTFSTGNVISRYLVTNTYGSGSSKTPAWTTLWATLKDTSASGSVTARLIEVEKCSGNETELCSITSTDSADIECESCAFSSSAFDFGNNTYYVEVTLARTATSAVEEIYSVAVN